MRRTPPSFQCTEPGWLPLLQGERILGLENSGSLTTKLNAYGSFKKPANTASGHRCPQEGIRFRSSGFGSKFTVFALDPVSREGVSADSC